MADLLTKALLNADVDAKVTTNGANENTGARVNDCLNNIVDTFFGVAANAPTLTFSTNTDTAGSEPLGGAIRFNNATIGSVTQIALGGVVNGVNKGDLFTGVTGILRGHVLGTTDTFEFLITGVPTFGLWTLVPVTYLKGTIPTNLAECAIDFLPANTINAATTSALALKADIASIPKRYKWIGDGGGATGTVVANTLGVTINVTNPGTGTYVFTAASGTPFTAGKTTISVQAIGGGTAYFTDADNPGGSTTIQAAYIFDAAGAFSDTPRYQVIIEVEP